MSGSSVGVTAPLGSSGHSALRRRKEKRRVPTIDPRIVLHCRSGHTRLINIREFVQRYTELQARLSQTCTQLLGEAGGDDTNLPDLSVDDIAIPTPFQAIEKMIDVEVTRVESLQDDAKKALHDAAQQAQKGFQLMMAEQQQQQQQQQQQARAILLQQQYIAAALNPLLLPMMQAQQAAAQQARDAAAAASGVDAHQQQQQQQDQEHEHGDDSDDRMDGTSQLHMNDHAAISSSNPSSRGDIKKELSQQSLDGSGGGGPATSGMDLSMSHASNADLDSMHAAAASSSSLAALPDSNSRSIGDSSQHAADQEMTDHHQTLHPLAHTESSSSHIAESMNTQLLHAAAASPSSMDVSGPSVAASASSRAPSHPTPEWPFLPPDFGSDIPNYDQLVAPLKTLQKDRQRMSMKRHRTDANCMTTTTFEYDIKSRTGHVPPVPLPPDEVLLRVAVYHPSSFTKTQEFIVLGSAPLTSLRDRIYCLHDHTLDGPQTPSACFFIENKFYNDLRDPRSIMYSSTILEWIKGEGRSSHPGLGHFEEFDMEHVPFHSLSIRLGAHYLYQHQGDCIHTIIFTQLRMSHRNDVQNTLAYPLKPFQCKTKRRKCRVCDLYPAAYVTYGDKLANENPFFYCEECYRPLHYSYEGNLLYNDFQVYTYDHE